MGFDLCQVAFTENKTLLGAENAENEIERGKILCMNATWYYIVNSRQSQIKLGSGQK